VTYEPQSHLDQAPYLEQTGHPEELRPSLSVSEDTGTVTLSWACPICHGEPQSKELESGPIYGITEVTARPAVELICRCGHMHKDGKEGCGYGTRVAIRAPAPRDLEGDAEQKAV
jgi:hypothetical protein